MIGCVVDLGEYTWVTLEAALRGLLMIELRSLVSPQSSLRSSHMCDHFTLFVYKRNRHKLQDTDHAPCNAGRACITSASRAGCAGNGTWQRS